MKVAVVGSGVSGLGATWLLNEHSEHEVHLYEADSRPGGHANTVTFTTTRDGPTKSVDVDTGFIVLNPPSYPNFLRFLKLKNVPLLPTEMTFSVSRDHGLFEWAGNNLFTVFCQPSRLLDWRMWRLIYDVLRFNACAKRIVLAPPSAGDVDEISIGEYLEKNNYSAAFRDNYLIPMTAAVWSTPPGKCSLGFPARTLIQFMINHHLLQLTGKPKWLTISGGSRAYVERIIERLPKGQLHLSSPVAAVRAAHSILGDSPTVLLKTQSGDIGEYDHVIFACHSDQALAILQAGGSLTSSENEILGRFQWNRNEAVLHSDTKLMPRSRLAWSCWNYLTKSVVGASGSPKANIDQVALTYSMNLLQHIQESKYGPVLVTLNPPIEPAADTIVGRWKYDHPILDSKAVLSQSQMHLIQKTRGLSYAGAYLRYGFHEDGFTSGMRAATEHLGVKPPFELEDPDRTPKGIWVGYVFDLLEYSGMATVLRAGFWILITVLKIVCGAVLDLSHLDS